jgi:hypothetical protein
MKEYVIRTNLNGEDRRLLILHPMDGLYKVYWDAYFLGTITPKLRKDLNLYWDADTEVLRDCVQEIGEYIESCDDLDY